jgi:hypothetical protein
MLNLREESVLSTNLTEGAGCQHFLGQSLSFERHDYSAVRSNNSISVVRSYVLKSKGAQRARPQLHKLQSLAHTL